MKNYRSDLTACAQAYLAEYGELPKTRADQDRYSSFRFGYEAGMREGMTVERSQILWAIERRND